MSVSVRPRPHGPRSTCPFCREAADEGVTPCACGVSYHPECRAELSRCVTIGCAGKSAVSGQRGAHRDVACVRCQGLIRNDGDMCFGCWSAYHRRCMPSSCCPISRPNTPSWDTAPRPRSSAAEERVAAVGIVAMPAILGCLVARAVAEWEWPGVTGLLIGATVGLVLLVAGLLFRGPSSEG